MYRRPNTTDNACDGRNLKNHHSAFVFVLTLYQSLPWVFQNNWDVIRQRALFVNVNIDQLFHRFCSVL